MKVSRHLLNYDWSLNVQIGAKKCYRCVLIMAMDNIINPLPFAASVIFALLTRFVQERREHRMMGTYGLMATVVPLQKNCFARMTYYLKHWHFCHLDDTKFTIPIHLDSIWSRKTLNSNVKNPTAIAVTSVLGAKTTTKRTCAKEHTKLKTCKCEWATAQGKQQVKYWLLSGSRDKLIYQIDAT